MTGKLALDSSNQWAVIFSPVGGPPRVAEVRFTGNSVIPADALLDAIAGVAIGSAYTETGFRALLESSVLPLYEARGRVRAAFPKVEAEKAKDVEGVSVTVSVDEGEVFNFGEVRLSVEGLPEAELQKAASFKTDGIANLTEIDAGIDRVRNRLRRTGYLKPDFRVERTLHVEKKTLDLVVHVDQGPQFHFGKLVVAGLEMNGEAEIRRRWAMKPGAPFDAGYPDYFLARIAEDGLFDNLGKTKSAVKLDDQSHTAAVTLQFR